MAITWIVENGYNERFAPAGAKKAYVARITGRDPKMTFAREFLGHGRVIVDEPGLYEIRETDKKGRPDDYYRVVLEHEGELRQSVQLAREDAMGIAKALASRSIDGCVELVGRPSQRDPSVTVYDARLVTAKQAERAAVAKSIDDATEACWQVVQGLTEADAKKVLTALKARVSPKKISRTVLSDQAHCGMVNDLQQDAGATPEQVGMDPTPVADGPQA
jgi:hypothetical protein